ALRPSVPNSHLRMGMISAARRGFARFAPAGRWIQRAWRYVPIRLPGLVVLAAGLFVAFRIGRAEADYLLYPAGLAAVGRVGVRLPCVALGAWRLRRALADVPSGVPENLETTHPTTTAFRVPRFGAWPLIEVTMVWQEPTTVSVALVASGGHYEETVTP